MDDATRAELENLRERAYGPGADISADPVALARLRQLEDAARGRTAATGSAGSPASVPGSASAPAPVGMSAPVDRRAHDPLAPVPPLQGQPPLPEQPLLPEQAPRADEPADREHAAFADAALGAPKSRRRLVRVLWPVSILAAIVVTAGVTGAVVAASFGDAATSAGRPVGTLHLSTATPVQAIFGGPDADVAGALFHGLTVVRSPGVFGSGSAQCLTVYQTPPKGSDPTSIAGQISYGCAAGALPALVRIGVDLDSPPALRTAFPAGTGLQFVLQDDHVRVSADESGVDPAAS